MPGGSSDEMLVGIVALVLAGLLVRRVAAALRTGEVPLYRTRMKRSEVGTAKFNALVALNAVGAVVIAVIGADLLFGLGLKG